MGMKYKSEITTENFVSDKDLQLYNYGYQICHSSHSWGPGVKDHIKIHVIIKGKGFFSVDGKQYELTANAVFLSLPNKVIYYEADEQDPWVYTWVSFDGIKAKDYVSLTGLSESNPISHIQAEKVELIKHSVLELKDLKKQFKVSELLETSYLYKILGLLQKEHEVLSKAKSIKESYVKQALSIINMNYSSSINCESIAQQVGIHRKYLTKLFNTYLEVTPSEYLIRFRMEKAIKLLDSTELTVSEIAYSVGYKDPGVFSKTFKRVYNSSPMYYKKNGKSN